MKTSYNIDIDTAYIYKYIDTLVGKIYKILPLKENGEATLGQYLSSLQREMLGCASLLPELDESGRFVGVLAIVQYMVDNDCEVGVVRSDVFKAIGILKKIRKNGGVR